MKFTAIFALCVTTVSVLTGINGKVRRRPSEGKTPTQGDVGERLYLSPYIQSGVPEDLITARALSEVNDLLEGLQPAEQPVSYSGFITVRPETGSHLFFWFFPATEVSDPTTAPLSVWLQGGPGSSSMLGLMEINGPFSCIDDGSGDTKLQINPWAWSRQVNMLYIDNPTGTGFSHSEMEAFCETQDEVSADLYEFLLQWLTLFSEYQDNPFFVFGESYAGKYVPSLGRYIHDMNANGGNIHINLSGFGVGNGDSDPPNSDIYGFYLYQLGLLDEIGRDQCYIYEDNMKNYCANDQWVLASLEFGIESSYYLNQMGCEFYTDFRKCEIDPEEENFADFVNKASTRKAIHVGDVVFGGQSNEVYSALTGDLQKPERHNVEFLLDRYPYLIYNGNMDIVCHHSGNLEMFKAMDTWSGIDEYYATPRTIYRYNGEVVGYLKSVDTFRQLVVRNAGHMVPRDAPEVAYDFFNQFVNGNL